MEEELTHWKRLWCWEGLRAGGEGDDRGWDGWMASPTQWTWVWVNSGSWWWTGRPGVLQFMGSQRVGHDWATELNWTEMEEKRVHSTGDHRVPTADSLKQLNVWTTLCVSGAVEGMTLLSRKHNTTAKAPSLIKHTFPSWSRKHHQLKSQPRTSFSQGLTLPGRRAGHGPTDHGQVWFISGGKVGIELHHWELLAFESNAVSSPSFNTECIFSTFLSDEWRAYVRWGIGSISSWSSE